MSININHYQTAPLNDNKPSLSVDTLNAIQRLLDLKGNNTFCLTWKHIANALNHELYDEISSAFMLIVNGPKRFEEIEDLLEALKTEKHIDQNEINYIKQLINRAKLFYPPQNGLFSLSMHIKNV